MRPLLLLLLLLLCAARQCHGQKNSTRPASLKFVLAGSGIRSIAVSGRGLPPLF